MEKFITATGKTIDLAIAAALEELHMDRDSVSVEVLENPRSGFLGIGAQPRASRSPMKHPMKRPSPPCPPLRAAGRKSLLSPSPQTAQRSSRPPPQRSSRLPRPKRPVRRIRALPHPRLRSSRVDRAPKQRGPRPERRDQKPRQPQQAEKPAVPAEPKVYAPAEPGSREERIEIFIKGLLEHMGSDAVPARRQHRR